MTSTMTDRITILDTQRTAIDRQNQTVVIGNALQEAAFSILPTANYNFGSGNEFVFAAAASVTFFENSSGPMKVAMNPQAVAQASWAGAVLVAGAIQSQAVSDLEASSV